jgi:hypothetical protein
MGENLHQPSADKGLISSTYKELKKLNNQKPNNPTNKWVIKLNRQFSEGIQMANEYMKKCSISLAIKEKQIKTSLSFHLTSVKMTINKKTYNN